VWVGTCVAYPALASPRSAWPRARSASRVIANRRHEEWGPVEDLTYPQPCVFFVADREPRASPSPAVRPACLYASGRGPASPSCTSRVPMCHSRLGDRGEGYVRGKVALASFPVSSQLTLGFLTSANLGAGRVRSAPG
jgi:hypothetical protein